MLSKTKCQSSFGKGICLLFCFYFFIFHFAFGQGGIWTWISGDSLVNSAGVYGIQGIPSTGNHPPELYEPCEWKDKQGNFWMYGGFDTGGSDYSDLWKYNPLTNEWTWVKGSHLINQLP